MTTPLRVPEGVRRRWLSQNPDVGPWLAQLPAQMDTFLEEWALIREGEASFGGTSIVLPVLDVDGRRSMLKLVSPIADARQEIRALQILRGHGVLDLHRADSEGGALLLEHLDGQTLEEPRDLHGAIRTCAEITAGIGRVPAPQDVPRMSDGAGLWREQLAAQHLRAQTEGAALADRVHRSADEIIAELAHLPCPTMTHGDLGLPNVMSRGGGDWAAIDPKLLAGPAENEVHTVLRTVPRSAVSGPGGVPAARRILEAMCRAGGLDVDLAARISQARFVASYYWESQHGGQTEDVAWLRAQAIG